MWLLIFGISSWSVMLLQWLSGYLIIKKVNSGEAEVQFVIWVVLVLYT